MKQLKFWMVAFTLLMGVSFTSCLDSGDRDYDDVYGFVLVHGYMGYVTFEDAAGNTYTPTQVSLTQLETNNSLTISEYKMGVIRGKTIEPETGAKTTTNTTFTLKAFYPLTYADAVVAQTKEEMDVVAPENSPVRTLNFDSQPWLFGNKNVLMIPISWRLQDDKEKFKLHKLALACALDEIEEGDTELVFYVRHDNGGDDKSDVYYADWYAYDIQYALGAFEAKTGKLPTKLVIKAHETGDYGTNEMPSVYTDYTVEYKVVSAN